MSGPHRSNDSESGPDTGNRTDEENRRTDSADERQEGEETPPDRGRDEDGAVTALERLGLSNYEARVFLALQRLGVGTAKEIHKLAGVPRSQVYGAAESLQERGLVDLQQSTPKRYRPVNPETARARLTSRLERERDHAFEYIESIRREGAAEEAREEVWTVRGRGPITTRVLRLIEEGDERITFSAAAPELATDAIREALVARADAGVEVTVVSANPAVRERFGELIHVVAPRGGIPVEFTGRMLLVDDRAVLLSVRVPTEGPVDPEETGIWTADTAMADVLVRTLRTGVAAVVGE